MLQEFASGRSIALLERIDELVGLFFDQLVVHVHDDPGHDEQRHGQQPHPKDEVRYQIYRTKQYHDHLRERRPVEAPRCDVVFLEAAAGKPFEEHLDPLVDFDDQNAVDRPNDNAEMLYDNVLLLLSYSTLFIEPHESIYVFGIPDPEFEV